MPPEKEVNFFSDAAKYSKGLAWYLDEYFGLSSPSKLWGEASPSYMSYDYIPKRISICLPSIKFVAILRDPVDRAYSHYRMSVERNLEGNNA